MEGFIYTLSDPRDGAVRYVGLTTDMDARRVQHEQNQSQGNYEKTMWQHGLSKDGLVPDFNVVEEDVPILELPKREKYWIQYYAANGCKLVNRPVGAIARADLATVDEYACAARLAREARDIVFELMDVMRGRCKKNGKPMSYLSKAENSCLMAAIYFDDASDDLRDLAANQRKRW